MYIYIYVYIFVTIILRIICNSCMDSCDSVLGGSLIIAGLYLVTWASYKEKQATLGMASHIVRSSEPLIHRDPALSKIHQIGHIFSGPSVNKALD